MDYISTKEAAERWGVTLRYVQKLLAEGRIPGARKYGVSWMLPANSERPSTPGSAAAQAPAPLCFVPTLYVQSSDLRAACRHCRSGIERALLEAQLAILRCEAQKAMDIALPLYQNAADASSRFGAGFTVALAAMSLGDAETWSRMLAQIEAIPHLKRQEYERALALTMLNTGLHGKSACPAWLEKGDFTRLAPELFPFARYLYVKNAYVNWKELELTVVAEPLISECHREKSTLAEIYLRILAAVAYHDLGKNSDAETHIAAAAAIAEPAMLFSPFVEYYHALGPIMDDCLKAAYPKLFAIVQEHGKPFWEHWVEIYNDLGHQPMASGLSPRELEAARLSTRGLTTREIAKRMGISQGSVKKYLNVAYNKLNVDNKEELRRLIHT